MGHREHYEKNRFVPPESEVRQRLLAAAGVQERMVRERERQTITGLSGTHWWLLEQRGLVPARLALGCKCIAWRLSVLLYWIENLESHDS